VRGVYGRFGGRPAQFGEALFATNLSFLTFGVSAWLSGATRWRVLSASLRSFLTDYAVTLAVIATTVASFCVRGVAVERISLPAHLSPTCYLAGGECVSEAESRFRQHARPWYVAGVLDAPARLWLVWNSPRPSNPKPHRDLNPNPEP
jgi:hypothetical protein